MAGSAAGALIPGQLFMASGDSSSTLFLDIAVRRAFHGHAARARPTPRQRQAGHGGIASVFPKRRYIAFALCTVLYGYTVTTPPLLFLSNIAVSHMYRTLVSESIISLVYHPSVTHLSRFGRAGGMLLLSVFQRGRQTCPGGPGTVAFSAST